MGGGNFRGLAGVLLVGALGLTGACTQRAPHRSDALARSRAVLERAAEIESELHAEEAAVDFYTELSERRRTTTEVACNVSQAHIKEIQRLSEAQTKKRREKMKARRVALASRTPDHKGPPRRALP